MGTKNDQLAYARQRLEGALNVLAEMETHGDPIVKMFYAGKLRTALAVGAVKIQCPCEHVHCQLDRERAAARKSVARASS